MHANEPYSATSLMSFQLSLLSLHAALKQSVSVGSTEPSGGAQVEVERLKGLIETHRA